VCLLSGVVLGLGSKWGVVRYWWVAVKLALNLVLTALVPVALRPEVTHLADPGHRGSQCDEDGEERTRARHFAERHGLIIIVALGESIVAIGVGVAALPISWSIIVASVLGLAISAALWWAYFDVVSLVAERVLAAARGEHRSRLARTPTVTCTCRWCWAWSCWRSGSRRC
jgi:low temperature requirement protein LtrA